MMDEPAARAAAFIVDLKGFEGPLDLLLDLARAQKVDLGAISILDLAEQYLAYLEGVGAAELPMAADYLVMAAWLAYLKSQLLLPPPERDEADPQALAALLEDRLAALDAMRRAGDWLMARPRTGEGRLARGAPEPAPVQRHSAWRASLADLLAAWRAVAARDRAITLTFPQRRLWTVEAAMERLAALLGSQERLAGQTWCRLQALLPADLDDGIERRSVVASGFLASLELARQGRIELEQAAAFAPVMLRRRV